MATAAIANGGTLFKPQVVNRIIDADIKTILSIEPEISNQDFIEAADLAVVRKGMRQAVFDGSAWALADLPVDAAGKTGTAQYGIGDQTHAWFTAFAPYQQPTIALAVIIEAGGEGSIVAGPVVKEVFEHYFNHLAESDD